MRLARTGWLTCVGLVPFACAMFSACTGPAPDPAAMAADLPEAVEVDPERRRQLEADVAAALAELDAGSFEAARRGAANVLLTDRAEPRARAILGLALAGIARGIGDPPPLSNWRRAEGELRRASALAPGDEVVTRLHTTFLEWDGHLSAAVERVERTLEARQTAGEPDSAVLLELAGRLRFELGDEQLAVRWADRQVVVDPESTTAAWRLAWGRARLALDAVEASGGAPGRTEEEVDAMLAAAEAAYSRYRGLQPDDAAGWSGLARVRLAQLERLGPETDERAAAASGLLDLYSTVERLQPGEPALPFARANLHELQGDAAAAERDYRLALDRDAGYLPAWLNLGALLAENPERHDEAAAVLRRALELEPGRDEQDGIRKWLAKHARGQ